VPELEKELGATYEEDLDAMLPKCDIIVINTPLTEKTRYNFLRLRQGVLF
jgi:formate dehydrogenase